MKFQGRSHERHADDDVTNCLAARMSEKHVRQRVTFDGSTGQPAVCAAQTEDLITHIIDRTHTSIALLSLSDRSSLSALCKKEDKVYDGDKNTHT